MSSTVIPFPERRTCPLCGAVYVSRPAMSRKDGRDICPDCGVRESMEYLGVGPEETEKVLDVIHRWKPDFSS